eukprot:1673213-Pyramimonas_sp.AAC.1
MRPRPPNERRHANACEQSDNQSISGKIIRDPPSQQVGMMAMIAKTGSPKQLHFTAVVTAPGEETLRGVLSTALELFHEQVEDMLVVAAVDPR